jgi:hypothetical protein
VIDLEWEEEDTSEEELDEEEEGISEAELGGTRNSVGAG